MTLIRAVRLIVARKVVERIRPLVATEREVATLRGVATTAEEVEGAKGVLECGQTFYEPYYRLDGKKIITRGTLRRCVGSRSE